MKTRLRSLWVALVASAALGVPAVGSAEPASTTFSIVGYEYAFTSTLGSFAGKGSGEAGERAAWNTVVKHDRLGSDPAYVNGGSFALTTRSSSGRLDAIVGKLSHHGGTITTLSRGPGCTNQRYRVTATLQDVRTRTSTGRSGEFTVILTHYRKRVLGRCVAYRARVAGTAGFTY